MINIIFCGYREWAVKVIEAVSQNPRVNSICKIYSKEDYDSIVDTFSSQIDFILFIGWSWIIPVEVTSKYLCLGIHPSDLPHYRGGSPLQHQIIAGIKDTKVSLMGLSNDKIDEGDIYLKEDLDLRGDNMSQVLTNLTASSIKMLNKFINIYPNVIPEVQSVKEGSYFMRRKPGESRILMEEFNSKSLEGIYNKLRCLTPPYPEAYIEDSCGNKLVFKSVSFLPSGEQSEL